MVAIHSTIGTLVVLGYLTVTILYVLNFTGRRIPQVRMVTFAAAGFLLLQYVLGFGLLGAGNSNDASHYAFALLALVPVGAEHGYAMTRENERQRYLYGAVASLVTLILVIATYIVGQSGS